MRWLIDAVSRRADHLLTKVLLGVIVGKFAGDLAALYLIGWLGREAGTWVGLLAGVAVFLLVPPLEDRFGDTREEE